jgi:DNA-binding PadR family transcriptional regulator
MSETDIVRRVHELIRGAIRLHILHHADQGEIHGAQMAAELARHGHHVSPGTLYPTLHRLEDEGFVVSHKAVGDGRARRVYRITAAGRRELADGRRVLRELADEVLG